MNWTEIKAEYVTTDTSYRKLSAKYGVSLPQIAKHGKDEDWISEKKRFKDGTYTNIIQNAVQEETKRTLRIYGLADKLLDKVEAILSGESESPLSSQTIKGLSGVLKDVKEIQDIKSEPDRREQELKIRSLKNKAEEDRETSVTIKIAGGEDCWRS